MGQRLGRRGRRVRSRRAGFSLLEIAVATVLLMIAIGGLSGVLVASVRLNQTNRETALALSAARQAVETLQAEPFREVFARYNTDPGDDPAGAGTAPGPGFAVVGLTAQLDDLDGWVGEYEFPVAPGIGTSVELREDFVDANLGMPRDLNGDGVVDALNHAGDYRLLPVRVRLRWRGVNGEREFTVETFLGNR